MMVVAYFFPIIWDISSSQLFQTVVLIEGIFHSRCVITLHWHIVYIAKTNQNSHHVHACVVVKEC